MSARFFKEHTFKRRVISLLTLDHDAHDGDGDDDGYDPPTN